MEKLRIVLEKDEIFENEMMNKHTTFELGGPAKFFIKPKSVNILISFEYNYCILCCRGILIVVEYSKIFHDNVLE